jgi:hypothetical protein
MITDRLNGTNGNVAMKPACKSATSGNITLSGLQTIDVPFSITAVEGDRVLVRLQTNEAQNGIYIASTGEWVRSADFNGAKDIVSGTYVRVNQGTHKGLWYINNNDPIVIGTSAITFTKIIDNSSPNLGDLIGTSDNITQGATNLFLTTSERTKLSGIAAGAEVNVNADWNAVSGDAQILNKPSVLVSGNIGITVQAYDADILKADTTDVLTVGYATTPYDAGTKSSGTFTPNEANGQQQYYVNGGAHTLAPPTNNTVLTIQVTNNGSAGTITTSGFTIVTGAALTTTNGNDFFLRIEKLNGFSQLHVTALQ